MSIDQFHGRVYHKINYNCYHFARDVWIYLTGQDLFKIINDQIFNGGKLNRAHVRAFRNLEKPVSPCLAIMQNPKESPHIGVYYKGRILHITKFGVEYQPELVACRGHRKIRYATVNH